MKEPNLCILNGIFHWCKCSIAPSYLTATKMISKRFGHSCVGPEPKLTVRETGIRLRKYI